MHWFNSANGLNLYMRITRLFHQGKRTIAFCIGAIMLCTSCSLLNRLPDEDKVMQSLD